MFANALAINFYFINAIAFNFIYYFELEVRPTFTLYVKNEQQHSTVAQKLLIKWWWNWPSIKSASATYNVLSFKNMFISSSVPRRVLSLKRFQRIWKSHSPLLHHNIASTLKWQVFQLRLIFLNYYYHLFLKLILFWQWCT